MFPCVQLNCNSDITCIWWTICFICGRFARVFNEFRLIIVHFLQCQFILFWPKFLVIDSIHATMPEVVDVCHGVRLIRCSTNPLCGCVVQNAVSVFCRLGFAKKKSSATTESGNSETLHDSWKNVEQQNIITRKCVQPLTHLCPLLPYWYSYKASHVSLG